MKITNLTAQQRDPNRVNVSVEGKYRFSLDIAQIVSLGVKVGREYTEQTVLTPTTTFDKETMNRIDKLITPGSDTNQDLVLPDGRINPFVE